VSAKITNAITGALLAVFNAIGTGLAFLAFLFLILIYFTIIDWRGKRLQAGIRNFLDALSSVSGIGYCPAQKLRQDKCPSQFRH